jgi:hypothetical protein
MVTIPQCEPGGNTTIVDLADMRDPDIDMDSFIIVMDSTRKLSQKPHPNHNRILTII